MDTICFGHTSLDENGLRVKESQYSDFEHNHAPFHASDVTSFTRSLCRWSILHGSIDVDGIFLKKIGQDQDRRGHVCFFGCVAVVVDSAIFFHLEFPSFPDAGLFL
jgi:hypothetical protein